MGAWESGKAEVDCGAALIQAVSFVAKGKGARERLVNFKPKRPMRKFGILFNPLNPCRS